VGYLEGFCHEGGEGSYRVSQSPTAVGGQGCSGGAVGMRMKMSDKKRLNLKSLTVDFTKLCR
jgi:hypothetical protein